MSSLSKEMKCEVCGNPAASCKKNKGKTLWNFDIKLRSRCKSYMTVPCFIRKQINGAMGDTMPVKTEDEDTYNFKLEKRSYKTRIYGTEYNEFLNDYDMQPYDVVNFKFCTDSNYLMMQPLRSCGCSKERLPEEYDFENDAAAVVYSRVVTPTPKEMSNINNIILDRGLGLGVVFIHRLTDTDINHYGLRIPKLIVSELGISPSGSATLMFGDDGVAKKVAYYPTTDSRLCFDPGWIDFAAENDLKIGMMVLIMFHTFDGKLELSVDVVGN